MNTLPNPLHGDWVDSMADWAVQQQPAPAEACTELGADTASTNLSGFPLEPYLTRHVWLGPLLVALIGFVWLCLDGYLENLP